MIALYVLGALLLLLFLLMFLRVGIRISYYGGMPTLGIKLGFIEFEDILGKYKTDGEELDIKPELKTKKKTKKAKEQSNPSIKDALSVVKTGFLQLFRRFKKYARLDMYRLRISLATDDPAKTAVLYGALSGVVSAMHSFALSVKNRSYREGDIYTEYRPDFYAEKSDIAVDIGISLRVWQILACALVGKRTYDKYKKLPPKAVKGEKGDTK